MLIEKSAVIHLIYSAFSSISKKTSTSRIASVAVSLTSSEKLKKSFFIEKAKKIESAATKKSAKMKRAVSRQFSDSKLLRLFKKIRTGMLYAPLRSYGVGFLLFGIFSAFIAFAKQYFSDRMYFEEMGIYIGIISVITSFFMIGFSKSLIELLCESASASYFVENILCMRTHEILEEKREVKSVGIAVSAGIIFGALSLFIQPARILICLLSVLIAILILLSPEFGVNLFVFMLPFVSEKRITAILLLSFISYLLKLTRGKRIFYWGATEILPIIIGFIGIIRTLIKSSGSQISVFSAISILLAYICVRNMFRSRNLSFALGNMIGTSFFIVYLIRLIYCVTSYFNIENGILSIVSGISDSSAITEYAILCVGFALYLIGMIPNLARKIALCAVIAISVTVPFATGDKVMCISVIAAVLTYALFSKQKSAIFAIPMISLVPFSLMLFSETSTVKTAFEILNITGKEATMIVGDDLLYVYGVGGMILFIIFSVISVSERFSVNCGDDTRRRSLYAAASSAFISAICSIVLNGISLRLADIILLVTVIALSSAANKDAASKNIDVQGDYL